MKAPLIIGGIPLPTHAGLQRQEYEPLGGSTLLRMANGAGKKRTHWSKLRTTISGSGWLPLALGSLDYSQPIEIACVHPRSMSSASSQVFALPSNRRRDVAPWGMGLVGDRWWPLEVTEGVESVTLEAIEGGSLYQVYWLPLLQVYLDDPTVGLDFEAATYDWTIEAEEA